MPKAIPLNARGNYCRKVYESKIHLYDLPAAAFHLKAEVSDVVSAARKTDSLRCKSCHFTGKLFGNQTWTFRKGLPLKVFVYPVQLLHLGKR